MLEDSLIFYPKNKYLAYGVFSESIFSMFSIPRTSFAPVHKNILQYAKCYYLILFSLYDYGIYRYKDEPYREIQCADIIFMQQSIFKIVMYCQCHPINTFTADVILEDVKCNTT